MSQYVRWVSAAATALLLLLTASAHAAKPQRIPPPDQLLDLTFDAGLVCPFALRYQELVNNETTTLLGNGRRRVNGAYKVRLTNTATGASIDVNASGPQFFTDTGDPATGIETAVLPGPQLFLLVPGDAGGPGAFLARGRSLLTRDFGLAQITSLKLGGNVTDLCSALAAG
jgi:hypothetical protein